MRFSYILGGPVALIELALASCQPTRDMLFLDVWGLPGCDTPLLTLVTVEPDTGAYTFRSQTGSPRELCARGATLQEAAAQLAHRWEEWQRPPPDIPQEGGR